MRGYVATVIGGMVGFVVSYVVFGRLLGDVVMRISDAYEGEPGPEILAGHMSAIEFAYVLSIAGVVVAGALAAGLSVRTARAGSGLETGVVTAILAAPGAILLFSALNLIGRSDFLPEWLAATLALVAPLCVLVLARWIGVRWHHRRTAAAK